MKICRFICSKKNKLDCTLRPRFATHPRSIIPCTSDTTICIETDTLPRNFISDVHRLSEANNIIVGDDRLLPVNKTMQ